MCWPCMLMLEEWASTWTQASFGMIRSSAVQRMNLVVCFHDILEGEESVEVLKTYSDLTHH